MIPCPSGVAWNAPALFSVAIPSTSGLKYELVEQYPCVVKSCGMAVTGVQPYSEVRSTC